VALLAAFVRVFTDRPPLTIHCESHGRETSWLSVDKSNKILDVSRIVGWFTSIWPCPVSCAAASSLKDVLGAVHEIHFKMPFHGWGYFTSQYLNPEGRIVFGGLNTRSVPEIGLNYTGLYHQLRREGGLFQETDALDWTNSGIIKSAKRFGLIEISVGVRLGCAVFDVAVNKHMERQE
jgi:hypothetical protein